MMKLPVEDDLIRAISNKNVDLVKELIEERALMNMSSMSATNALSVACSAGCFKIVELLINYGDNAISLSRECSPILALCSSSYQNEDELLCCLDLLLSRGADKDTCDSLYCSALSFAVKLNHEKIIMKLLNDGADLNKADLDGWSPIFYAVVMNNIYLVSILKDYGADIYKMDQWGRSLVDLAQEVGNSEIVLLLNGSHELTKWYEHLPYEQVKHCGIYETLLSKLPFVQDRLSGFDHECQIILDAVKLGYLSRHLKEHNIGFGHLLTMSDDKLKKIGINFVYERKKLLHAIREFHEHSWSTSSLVASNAREFDLQITQLVMTITRQLYIISVASYLCSKQVGIVNNLSTLQVSMKDCLKTIRILKNTLKNIQIFFMEASRRHTLAPSDLIVSHKIHNNVNRRSILVNAIVCGVCLYMTNIHSKIFQYLKTFIK